MSLPNKCQFFDKCEHKVSEASWFDLCMGHQVCRDRTTPYREAVCAWFEQYKNPPGTLALPRDREKEA